MSEDLAAALATARATLLLVVLADFLLGVVLVLKVYVYRRVIADLNLVAEFSEQTREFQDESKVLLDIVKEWANTARIQGKEARMVLEQVDAKPKELIEELRQVPDRTAAAVLEKARQTGDSVVIVHDRPGAGRRT